MRISLLEPLGIPADMVEYLAQPLREMGHTFVYFDDKTTDVEELKRRSAGAEIVMIANNPYPDEVVCAADSLQMLDVAFTGIDHVGQVACKERGVTVCNAAGYSNQTVAELAVGLTIDVLRHISASNEAVRNGATNAGFMGTEICGKTVGIIGTGQIGCKTALLFRAFGANVVAYSRTKKPELEACGVRYLPLEQMLAESDILSVHLPLNGQTRGFLSRDRLAMMKPNAVLINCARGPVVDNQALAEALNNGALAGAGVDVFDMEPPIPQDYPLLQAKNTVLTPHLAFLSQESMVRRAAIAFRNVLAYLKGKPENVCTL